MTALINSMTGDHPARPCVVISTTPKVQGLRNALERNTPTVTLNCGEYDRASESFERDLDIQLKRANAELICLAGFMRILSADFVGKWQGRILNIHPSLLPKFKGLNTHARVLAAGETVHGCTVHQVTAKLDDGPILGQLKLTVHKHDTAVTLADRVLKLEHVLYPVVLRHFIAGDLNQAALN